MATLTLDQKRLEQLRTQLYGKPVEIKTNKKSKDLNDKKTETIHNTPNSGTDNYIKKDLSKVLFLSISILLLQFVIHYALANQWLVINFYGITY